MGTRLLERDSSQFNYDTIPVGFYDEVAGQGNPIRRCWHLEKFDRVVECLPTRPGQSLLDIGCFAGTFLARLSPAVFSDQLGVDIIQKQVEYAQQKYGTDWRRFQYVRSLAELSSLGRQFDCVTLIEVIEHLSAEEIRTVLRSIRGLLKPGGKLIISSPNYTSAWPLIELILNYVSDVTYEEQHITKFNYFNFQRKLASIDSEFASSFSMDFKTTTHFITPFLAGFSLKGAQELSRVVPHNRWKFPFGNLVLGVFTRR